MTPKDDEKTALAELVLEVCGKAALGFSQLQSLWGGYGQIVRVSLAGGGSVIVKAVQPPDGERRGEARRHDRGHARKLRSYDVEAEFYRTFAARCGADCPLPVAHHVHRGRDNWLFVLEDLDARGFSRRSRHLSAAQVRACLAWLAAFHAEFLGTEPVGLWPEGSYWHFDTRPDEWVVMAEGPLKQNAQVLDARLRAARHRTLVHGDAKVANFCFARGGSSAVAAVDFQYVGGGVGVRDVAYLLHGIVDEQGGVDELGDEAHAVFWLDEYFVLLRDALYRRETKVDVAELEGEWRALYPVAWADFSRFLAGWAPGSAHLDAYGREMLRRALAPSD